MEFDLDLAWRFLDRFGLPLALVVVIVMGKLVPRWAYDALHERCNVLEKRVELLLEATDRATRTLQDLVELIKRRGE